jgi:phosphoketolase
VTDAPLQTFRVTVRGQFHGLTERAQRFLLSSADEHDIFVSKFSEEGTFTYDRTLVAFNFRYELRASGVDAANVVKQRALDETTTFLTTMGIGHNHLSVKAMDMSAMWDRAERR